MLLRRTPVMPTVENAIPNRSRPILKDGTRHFIFDRPLQPPYPDGVAVAIFGMGCFWGAERKFWSLGADRVWTTAVGYAGGFTAHPSYEDVCSGRTGHTEVVLVAYQPGKTAFADLLKIFWEAHDPTQGFRQGNDIGTQYRSAIFTTTPEQRAAAEASRDRYSAALAAQGFGNITTEIADAPPFYFAEVEHQQYLAKVPAGYCGLGGTGVSCQ